MKIEIKKIELPNDKIYVSDAYPHGGIFDVNNDQMNYFAVSKQYNIVAVVYKDCFIGSEAKETPVVDASRITVDEALRLIAVSKDAKYINTVLKNEN